MSGAGFRVEGKSYRRCPLQTQLQALPAADPVYCRPGLGFRVSNLEYKTPKRCVSPLRQRLAVVKWYRIDADWDKPDPTLLADR